jgi:pimeloyl-ACP methyl ester carboxylesterase
MARGWAVATALLCVACASAPPRPESQPIAAPERFLFVEGGAGRLRVSDGGAGGTPVLFLHGLGVDLESWRAQLDHLRPARRAIAYDHRGHGGSDPARDGVYTVPALAEDLELVVRALALDRFFLVGHSMSGALLTAYAASHPEKVAGLVYADAVGDFHAVAPQQVEAMKLVQGSPSFGKPKQREAFGQMLVSAHPATRERVLAALDRLDTPAFPALRRSMADFSAAELLPRYGGPRLAIEVAGNGTPVLFSSLDRKAPRVAIPGVSHWLMMDDPDAFDRALDPFIGFEPRR